LIFLPLLRYKFVINDTHIANECTIVEYHPKSHAPTVGEIQETTMQEKDGGADEFLLELTRMRNSLNALTLKNFMFDKNFDGGEEIISMEVKAVATSEDVAKEEETLPSSSHKPPISFRRSLSKHRQDGRTQSGLISHDDVLKALSESEEKLDETAKIKSKVHFAIDDDDDGENEEEKRKKSLPKNSSRESDEVATINELPWQKSSNRGHKTVTPFFKPETKNQIKALSSENVAQISFRPIKSSKSIEEVDKQIVRPVPLLASISYQELPTVKNEFKSLDDFVTKSNEDLLLDDVDGTRRVKESKTHKLLRIRSVSNNSLDWSNEEQVIYENFDYEIPLSTDNVTMRKKLKPPVPQPRLSAEINSRNRNSIERKSKTIVYVLDKEKDEFVLESPEPDEEEYEAILYENCIDQYRDSAMFNALLNSRDDCKSESNFFFMSLVWVGLLLKSVQTYSHTTMHSSS
jgi:hypothetical protein